MIAIAIVTASVIVTMMNTNIEPNPILNTTGGSEKQGFVVLRGNLLATLHPLDLPSPVDRITAAPHTTLIAV
jgi:hypothetical protein